MCVILYVYVYVKECLNVCGFCSVGALAIVFKKKKKLTPPSKKEMKRKKIHKTRKGIQTMRIPEMKRKCIRGSK